VVRACPRDRRRRDLDNLFKAVLDSFEKNGAFGDDRQISRIDAELCRCRNCPFAYDCNVFTLEKEKDGPKKEEKGRKRRRRATAVDGGAAPALVDCGAKDTGDD